MSNTVLIRASRCIYSIPLEDWRVNWCPCLPKLDEWFVTIGEKYVVFEYGDICHRMDEHYFNTLLPRIPYSSRFNALRNGKGVLRTERSYRKKGMKKHASNPD